MPLGDLHPRRALVTRLFWISAAALVACALAPNLWFFGLASVAVGGASVAGQVMIPFAADLAPEERRGRVVARIMTGLLLGILLARTVSGLVAQAAGWRAIYWLSAALMVCFALVLWRALPTEGPRPQRSYPSLVSSSLRLLGDRARAAAAGLARGLRVRRLQRAVDHDRLPALGEPLPVLQRGHRAVRPRRSGGHRGGQPGRQAGRLGAGDRNHVVAGVLLVGSFALLWAGRTSLAALIIGIVVLDMGTQGMQITNQAVIYALRPDARSRINSAYMVCYFLGRRRRLRECRCALRHPRLGGRLPARRRLRHPHARHVGLRPGAAGRGRSDLDDLEPVAVLIAEREHRRHAGPPQHVVGVDAA